MARLTDTPTDTLNTRVAGTEPEDDIWLGTAREALAEARPLDSHKGSNGTVALLGGAPGMVGALLLAGRAALRIGAGKVFLGFSDPKPPMVVDPLQPELMLRGANELLAHAPALGIQVWALGCGLGQDRLAAVLLREVLAATIDAPLVLDADALNLLAQGEAGVLPARRAPWVLTPHPLEAARLLGSEAAVVQEDRPAAARQLAKRFGAWVVLKGAGTIVCSPEGAWQRNPSGNPALATAGTGDVLTGMIASLLAQGLSVESAVMAGVWLHGAAADRLVADGTGPIGVTAGELADAARWVRNHALDADVTGEADEVAATDAAPESTSSAMPHP